LFDSHGNVKNIYINRDITEKKRNEEEFKRLSLVASLNNGVVFTSPMVKYFGAMMLIVLTRAILRRNYG
jgi:hypothetical protein